MFSGWPLRRESGHWTQTDVLMLACYTESQDTGPRQMFSCWPLRRESGHWTQTDVLMLACYAESQDTGPRQMFSCWPVTQRVRTLDPDRCSHVGLYAESQDTGPRQMFSCWPLRRESGHWTQTDVLMLAFTQRVRTLDPDRCSHVGLYTESQDTGPRQMFSCWPLRRESGHWTQTDVLMLAFTQRVRTLDPDRCSHVGLYTESQDTGPRQMFSCWPLHRESGHWTQTDVLMLAFTQRVRTLDPDRCSPVGLLHRELEHWTKTDVLRLACYTESQDTGPRQMFSGWPLHRELGHWTQTDVLMLACYTESQDTGPRQMFSGWPVTQRVRTLDPDRCSHVGLLHRESGHWTQTDVLMLACYTESQDTGTQTDVLMLACYTESQDTGPRQMFSGWPVTQRVRTLEPDRCSQVGLLHRESGHWTQTDVLRLACYTESQDTGPRQMLRSDERTGLLPTWRTLLPVHQSLGCS
ncbi:hypothetical protein NHX12_004449 [Muraenolepis orangiensis]|uniref:Uncharacterized protein n=1 Tax=Muraenolepis orangiensis TaxID=630683 RepID=A0A9Q0DXS6_9TELE|nr:hypothetical protein NHX12_004449 [Muraenolepis orangiensis]